LQITSAWNPEIARHQLAERFAQGASLWLFKVEGKLAAYGWTIIGRTMEPHFMPLGANDAHLFDYFVFPEYRGRRINPALVNHVLARLVSERRNRAYIEAAAWNLAQLNSLGRTPFRPLGRAWKFGIFGKTVVIWSRN
jgi:GNAT superfamily N-acetyltransferase